MINRDLSMLDQKVCRTCKESKPLDQFHRESGTKDGRRGSCKVCKNLNRRINHSATLAKEAEYRKARKLQIADINARYYAAHKDERLAYDKKYRLEHPDASYRRVRKFRKNNPEQARANVAARRVRLSSSMDSTDKLYSVAYRKAIKDDPCYYCNSANSSMQDDHYFAVAKGGTDHWFNLVRACARCNNSKNDKCGTWMKLKVGIQ